MISKTCEICQATFAVRPYRATTARFCSQRCGGVWHAETRLAHVPKPWALGNKWRVGKPPANKWLPGHEAWNRGLKGIHLSPDSEFAPGHEPSNKLPVGSERARAQDGDGPRVWVKIGEPSVWRPRAIVVWERAHGPVADGLVVHHKNRDTLDDDLDNLQLTTRADHICEHRVELNRARLG